MMKNEKWSDIIMAEIIVNETDLLCFFQISGDDAINFQQGDELPHEYLIKITGVYVNNGDITDLILNTDELHSQVIEKIEKWWFCDAINENVKFN